MYFQLEEITFNRNKPRKKFSPKQSEIDLNPFYKAAAIITLQDWQKMDKAN